MRMGNMYERGAQQGPGRSGPEGHGRHGETGGKANQAAQHGPDDSAVASTTLDMDLGAVTAELTFMIEEEKLASDLYAAFYDLFGMKIFDNISSSEDRHFEALLSQAKTLGVDTDTFVFNEPDVFEDAELQQMYDALLAQGSASAQAALGVGIAIEQQDMVDLANAAAAVEGTQLANVYESLIAGSQNHLDAFEHML